MAELEENLADALQCASVEADLRREFKARAEKWETRAVLMENAVKEACVALAAGRPGQAQTVLRHALYGHAAPTPAPASPSVHEGE